MKLFLQYTNSILLLATNILFTTALINAISKERYGEYSLMLSFLVPISILTSFGIPGLLKKVLPDLHSNLEKRKILSIVILFKIIIGVTLFFLGGLFVDFNQVFFLLFGYFLFFLLNQILFDNYLVIEERQYEIFLFRIFYTSIKLISIYSLTEVSVVNALIILFLAEALGILFLVRHLTLKVDKYSLETIKSQHVTLKIFTINGFAEILLNKFIAVWIVSYFLLIEDVASFSFVCNIAFLFLAAASVASRFETILIARRNEKSSYIRLYKIVKLMYLFQLIGGACLFVPYHYEILSLVFDSDKYGEQFFDLALFTMAILITHMVYFFSADVYDKSDFKVFLNSLLISGIVHIMLSPILVYFLGYQGALVALVFAYFVKLASVSIQLGIHTSARNFFPQLLVCIISCGLCYLIKISSIDNLYAFLWCLVIMFFSFALVQRVEYVSNQKII